MIHIHNLLAESRGQVYDFLATEISQLVSSDPQRLNELLKEREEQGSIEIASGVLLPHCEVDCNQHGVVVVRLCPPIPNWSDKVAQVEMVIGLIIAEKQDKTDIIRLMRCLADEHFINQLKTLNENEVQEVFYGN